MADVLSGLRALLRRGAAHRHPHGRCASERNVMLGVTLDAQHATPLRQALIRDCADQPWTIRVTQLHQSGRVRLSLYLPKAAVARAMQRVTDLEPKAEFGQLLEIPPAPTEAWPDLTHSGRLLHAEAHGRRKDDEAEENALVRLISEAHVLLGLEAANRDELFAQLGRCVEQRYGLASEVVTASLRAREALGSTGLGKGVAVPHGQIKGLRTAMAFYIRPAAPLPFDAPDGQGVTDLIALLVPEQATTSHLHLLADIAGRFCDHHFREQLQRCRDAHAVCQLFAQYDPEHAVVRDPSQTRTERDLRVVVEMKRPRQVL
jgi:nitrogen PTS system EIIA component